MVILGSKEKLCSSLMETMNSLRKEQNLVDVCIKVDENEIKAHKSVLASGSEYFFSCFAGPLKIEDHVAEIDLSTIALDADSVEAVVDFLYTGEIDIHGENLEAILKLATFLLISPLVCVCIEYMEQCCDLESFLKYYILSVNYMVADAELIAIRAVKPRFHDYFIHQESTTDLSPFHLQKLIEDYNIFQHCTEIDWLSFLIDWVYTWQTEGHMELVCKIMNGEVAPIYYDESQSDDETQNDDQEQSNESQSDSQIDNCELEECSKTARDDTQASQDELYVNNESGPPIHPHDSQDTVLQNDVNEQHVEDTNSEADVQKDNHVSQENAETICDDTQKSNDEPSYECAQQEANKLQDRCKPQSENKHLCDHSEAQNDTKTSCEQNENHFHEREEMQSNENKEINKTEVKLQRLGFDIPNSFKKIKNKLESANCPRELLEKCDKIIDLCNRFSRGDIQVDVSEATRRMLGTDVEHVLMVISPKKILKDFHEEVYQDDEEISGNADDAIFDVFVYVPQTLTWYNFGEGKNTGIFKKMGKGKLSPSLSFCMLDRLCFASKDGSLLHMYSFEPCLWTSISFESLKTEFHNPGFFGRDRNSYEVKLFCMDGKNLYLVLKVTHVENNESKVKFKCFWSLFPKALQVVSETPFIHESEDAGIKDGKFDATVSQENEELLVVAKGAKLHVFVADLQNKGSQMKHSTIEDDEHNPGRDAFWRTESETRLVTDRENISLMDELLVDERLLYRNRKCDLSGSASIENTTHEVIDTRFPKDYGEYSEPTTVKLSQSVSDGTSLWLYLSDGKFDTSLTEMRPDESGYIEFIEHTPPPFTAITLLAPGKVKVDHLFGLKPITNFIQA